MKSELSTQTRCDRNAMRLELEETRCYRALEQVCLSSLLFLLVHPQVHLSRVSRQTPRMSTRVPLTQPLFGFILTLLPEAPSRDTHRTHKQVCLRSARHLGPVISHLHDHTLTQFIAHYLHNHESELSQL